MRISDWSSDVCSSDLAQPGDLLAGIILPATAANNRGLIARIVGESGFADGDDIISNVAVTCVLANKNDAVDGKSVVSGKRVAVRVDLGGRLSIKTKKEYMIRRRCSTHKKNKQK